MFKFYLREDIVFKRTIELARALAIVVSTSLFVVVL